MKGYIGKKSFEDCLKDKSMIKLDLVYLLNGVFVEISEVYFLRFKTIQTIMMMHLIQTLSKQVFKMKYMNF